MKPVHVAALVIAAAGFGAGLWSLRDRFASVASPPPISAEAAGDAGLAAALRELDAAVRAEPRSAAPWARLGMTYQVHEMPAEAETCYAQAARLDPTVPQMRWFRALALESLGRFDEAMDEARAVFERAPDYAPARAVAARWMLARGRAEEAAALADAATAAAPGDCGAWIVAAEVRLDRGDAAGAEQAARRALACEFVQPQQQAFAHYVLGRTLQAQGRADAARPHLARVRDGDARAALADPWTWELGAYRASFRSLLYAAHEALGAGDHGTALALLAELSRRDPDHLQVAIDRGRALRETGETDASLEAIDLGLRARPGEPALLIERALTLERMGDDEGALRELSAVLAKDARNAAALETRGSVHMRRERTDAAVRDFEAAFRAQPERAWVLVHAGVALLEADDVESAAEEFRRAVDADPGLADGWAGLAVVAARRGDRAAAAKHLALAESLDARPSAVVEEARDALGGR